jgi:hypothetical protein
MDPEAEQIREVFALYGRAMYFSQCLEKQLAISLASLFGPMNLTRADYDRLLSGNLFKTMGQHIHKMRAERGPEDQTDELIHALEQAKQARNLLAHNYFWQRALQFSTSPGRESMRDELIKLAQLFEYTDSLLTELTMSWANLHGVTADDVEQVLQSLMIQADN